MCGLAGGWLWRRDGSFFVGIGYSSNVWKLSSIASKESISMHLTFSNRQHTAL